MSKNKLSKYPVYKDSAVEWLGEIPEHWKITRLKNIIKSKITDGPHTTPEFIENGIPFLSVDGIQDGELVFENCRKISLNDHIKFQKKCKIEKFDILMGKAASIGKIAQAKVDFEFSIWSPLALIKPKLTKINSTFLEYYLKSTLAQYQIEILCTSNTQKNISMDDIPKIISTLPPLSEQEKIAHILDDKTTKIDQAIAIKQKQIELLKERRQILIHKAVTRGLNDKVKMKDSGVEWIGEIPEHWEVKKIKNLGKIINGFAFNSSEFRDNGVRVMKISNIQTMKVDWTDESFVDEKYYNLYPQFQIKKNDLVFALTRPIISTGIKATIVDYDEKILLNQRNAVLKPHEGLLKNWIYFIILNNQFVQVFDNLIDKTGQQPNISTYNIGNLEIPFPKYNEQKEIAEFIETATTKIATAISLKEQEIDKLKEYKMSLIDGVVSGKVRVI